MTSYNPGSQFTTTSSYGYRTDPHNSGKTEFHGGVDYSAPLGTPIPAASNGVVYYSGYNPGGYGNVVVVKSTGANGSPYYTLYAHMTGDNMPQVGDQVQAGQAIGQLGNTGSSTGPHLHFEVLDGNAPVAHTAGGSMGFRSSDPSIRENPNDFANWSNGSPYNATTPVQDGTSYQLFDPNTFYPFSDPLYKSDKLLPFKKSSDVQGDTYDVGQTQNSDGSFVTSVYNPDSSLAQNITSTGNSIKQIADFDNQGRAVDQIVFAADGSQSGVFTAYASDGSVQNTQQVQITPQGAISDTINGTGAIVNVDSVAIIVATPGAATIVNGVSDNITLAGSNGTLSLIGSGNYETSTGDTIFVSGIGSSVAINGVNTVAEYDSNEVVSLLSTGSVAYTGPNASGDVFYANGDTLNVSTASVLGSNNTVYVANNSGSALSLSGTGNVVSSVGNTVFENGQGSSAAYYGANTVVANANSEIVSLASSGSTAYTGSGVAGTTYYASSDTVHVGNSDTLVGNSNQIALVDNSGSGLVLNGSGNTIFSSGNAIAFYGSNTSNVISGGANAYYLEGSNQTLAAYATDLAPGVTEEVSNYSGGGGTTNLVNRLFNFSDGTSELNTYAQPSTIARTFNEYTGANATGSVTQYGTVNADNSEQVTFINPYPGIPSIIVNYNPSGIATSGHAVYTGGGSANANYNYDGSGAFSYQTVNYYNSGGTSLGYENYNSSDAAIGGTYNGGDGSTPPPDSNYYIGYVQDQGVGGEDDFSSLAKLNSGAANPVEQYASTVANDPLAAAAAVRAQAQAVLASQSTAASDAATTAVFDGSTWNADSSNPASGGVITSSFATNPGSTADPFSSYLDAQYQSTVSQAFQAWAQASGLTFQEVSDSSASDIRIGWGDFDSTDTGVLGYTSYRSTAGSFQPGTIIRLEDPQQTALSSSTSGQAVYAGTDASLYQVVLHEIGHALGLADNADPSSVMFAVSSSANRTLDQTDVSGINLLYGASPLQTNEASVFSANAAAGIPLASPSSVGATGVNQMIQAMAAFSPQQSAALSLPLVAQNAALEQQLAAPLHS